MTVEFETRPAIDPVWLSLFTLGIGLVLFPVYFLSTDGVLSGAGVTLIDTLTVIALPVGLLLVGVMAYNARQEYEFTDDEIIRHIPSIVYGSNLRERLPYKDITAVHYESSSLNDEIGTISLYTTDPAEDTPQMILYRVAGFPATKAELEKHLSDVPEIRDADTPAGLAAVLFFTRQA